VGLSFASAYEPRLLGGVVTRKELSRLDGRDAEFRTIGEGSVKVSYSKREIYLTYVAIKAGSLRGRLI
jgi:hypothetical protein